jgi:hypothetical protein
MIRPCRIAEPPHTVRKAATLAAYVTTMAVMHPDTGGRGPSRQAPPAASRRTVGTALAVVAALMLAAFGLAEVVFPGDQEPVRYRAWQGAEAGASMRDTQVATTSTEWQALWSGLRRDTPPAFDPTRQTGVAILLGRQPVPGAQVDVLGTEQRGDRVIVVIEESRLPRARSHPRQVAQQPVNASPYAILLIDKSGAAVSVEQRIRD